MSVIFFPLCPFVIYREKVDKWEEEKRDEARQERRKKKYELPPRQFHEEQLGIPSALTRSPRLHFVELLPSISVLVPSLISLSPFL